MKQLNGCLIYFVVAAIIAPAIAWGIYAHEMAPTWADIAKKQAAQDLSIKKQNDEIQAREENQRAADWTEVQRMVLIMAALGFGGWIFYLMWERKDRRKESWARQAEGSFALQTVTNGETVWVVDPNKLGGDAVGLNKSTGLLGEHVSQFLGPDRQLTQNLAIQKTRTVTAASSQPIKYAAHAKMLAGGYDREPRQLAQTPAQDDGNTMLTAFHPLTVQDALAQSTAESWVLGQNQETGELFTLNIREIAHFGVVGATRSGKTSYIGLLMLLNALRSKWRVIVLDGKGGADWSKYADYVEYYRLDHTNVKAMLDQVIEEYERRQAKVNEAQVNSVWEMDVKPRPTMVIVDEFGKVMDSLKVADPAEYKVVSLNLGNLLRLSACTAIYINFYDQDPSKWPSAMRANLPINICFKLGGMKGNSISEYNLDELDRCGHFQCGGKHNRFHAWPTYRVVDAMLPSIEYKKPKALLAVHSDRSPFTVQSEGGDVGDTPTPDSERLNGERLNEPTDLEVLVWQWRDEHPQGTQAELRKDFERRRIEISKGHVFNCWHSWPNASPTPSDRGGTALDQLRALGYDPDQVRVKGGEKLGIDKTRKPEEL